MHRARSNDRNDLPDFAGPCNSIVPGFGTRFSTNHERLGRWTARYSSVVTRRTDRLPLCTAYAVYTPVGGGVVNQEPKILWLTPGGRGGYTQ